MLSVIVLSVIMLGVVMLSVSQINVVMLNVMAPHKYWLKTIFRHTIIVKNSSPNLQILNYLHQIYQ
jgi:hypothetical protein